MNFRLLEIHESLHNERDDQLLRRKLFIRAISLVLLVLPLGYIDLIQSGQFASLSINILADSTFVICIIAVKRVKNPKIFYRLLLMLGISLSIYHAIDGSTTGSSQSISALWLFFFPPFIYFLLGKKEATIWMLTTILTLVAAFNLSALFLDFPHPDIFKIRFLLVLTIISLLSYVMESLRHNYFNKITKQHMQLALVGAELKEKNILLQEQSNQRRQLVHMLCHDLANPIGSISTITGLMSEKQQIDPEMLKLLELSAVSSSEIIVQARELMAADKTIDKTTFVPLALQTLVEESKLMLSYRFAEKNIKLDLHIPESVVINVSSSQFINSILNNLFTNAIKFSPRNATIVCQAKLVQDQVKLSVKDEGIGMPEKILENLFNLEVSTSRNGTNGEFGTGFGMPLVKTYVEAFDGEIEVFSTEKSNSCPTSGTTVVITLPSYS